MRFDRFCHSEDVKGVPLSEVMCSGTLWFAIQVDRALMQDVVVASGIGMASGHRVLLSIIVNRYLKPSEGGRGPTKSTCMCEKRLVGCGISPVGGVVCLVILAV